MYDLQEILARCINGHHPSQQWLYNRYSKFATSITRRMISDEERVRDVVNDGFIKIFRHIDQFRCDQKQDLEKCFLGWMKTIMYNGAVDHLRKKKDISTYLSYNDSECNAPSFSRSDETVLTKDLIGLVAKLPAACGRVFSLIAISGLTHKEVSRLIGISESTSKSNYTRAKILLQKQLNWKPRHPSASIVKRVTRFLDDKAA